MSYHDSVNKDNEPDDTELDYRDRKQLCRVCRREARRRDPLRGLFAGLLLILIGTIFLLNQEGWLSGQILWAYLAMGIGAILIISGLVHYSTQTYRYHGYGKFIAGPILILAGVFGLIGWSQWWPFLMIAAGVFILFFLFLRREQIANRQ